MDTPLIRTAALPRIATGWIVGAVVLGSAALQTALAWRRATPGYFPDEYMYAELGRSLLETGSPLVRGEQAAFVSLLYPVLTAPAWLWDDVESAYRTIQVFNALAMSLAAVPAYLLARRLGGGARLSVGVAVLVVAAPELVYSGSVMAEAVAYPLAVAVAWATLRAVERPTVGAQALVLVLGAFAATARIQLAVLPLCYVLGVVVARRAGEHRLAVGAVALAAAAGIALALTGAVGIYGDVTAYRVDPLDAVQGLGATALVLAYASGWVLVPGAMLGFALALARPRSHVERAFGAFALSSVLLVLAQAAVVGDVGRAQERYALYALPLVLVLFSLYASRGWPWRRPLALLTALTATAAAVVPLAGWAAGQGSAQSLVLTALRRLEAVTGDVGLASLLVALAATALAIVVTVVAFVRPRHATAVALSLAAAGMLATTAAAAAFYHESREALRASFLAADPSWVDGLTDGPVTLLAAPRSTSPDLHSTLFWNRSVRHLALLPATDEPDAFAFVDAVPDAAGRVDLPTRLVLVDTRGSTVLLRNADRLGAGPTKALWRTRGTAQLMLLVSGRYYSGLLAGDGGIRVWPERPGGRIAARLELDLVAPRRTPFELTLPDGSTRRWTVRRGRTTVASIPVCSTGLWRASFATGSIGFAHGSRVGAVAGEPRLVHDAAACD